MTAAAARPKTGFKFMLTVKGGPDKGVSYQLLPPMVTIGRDASAHVSLTDPRVSRQAATIEFSMERILIKETSSRRTMLIDGVACERSELVDGSVIQIGDTKFVFAVEALPLAPIGGFPQASPIQPSALAPHLQVVPAAGQSPMNSVQPAQSFQQSSQQIMPAEQYSGSPSQMGANQNFGNPPPGASSYAPSPPSRGKSGGQGLSPTFMIIIAFIIGVGLMVALQENAKRSAARRITTSTDIQKEIDSSEKLQDELKKKRKFSSDEEKTRYEEANRHYLEGFRDYQNSQYSRAIRSFETALAIDPQNELARRYYSLAQKQRDDMVANLVMEGRQYRDKQMYTRCSAAFGKAMDFMPNRDDLKYKQAEAMKKECDLLDAPNS